MILGIRILYQTPGEWALWVIALGVLAIAVEAWTNRNDL